MQFFCCIILVFFGSQVTAQSFNFDCTRDTTINFCNNNQCIQIKAIIPDIHASSATYHVNPTSTIPGCFPVYVQPNNPDGTVPTGATIDDKYSSILNIGFTFSFYDSLVTQLVAGTNGMVSFDLGRANLTNNWQILLNGNTMVTDAPGVPLDLPSTHYDKAVIMGPFHDIDPGRTTSPTQRIQYQVVGTAPHRKWIMSFYKVPLYNCWDKIENTHQIVLYESTGIVEVLVFSKEICTSWNLGHAMIGMQNFTQNQAIMVNGRRASDPPWGSVNMNESYRFVPASGAPLFKRVELYDLSGNLINTGTATSLNDGRMEATFPQICPPVGTTSYIVKSVYSRIDTPSVEIYGTDTVRVTRTASTNLNAAMTATLPSACGPNGSATITVPAGVGVAPFAFAIDGGAPQNTSNHSYTFTGLTAGPHTVVVTDASGCSSTVTATVQSSGVLNVTPAITPSSCQGASNASFTITPQNGMSPFQYSFMNGAWQNSNSWTNLTPGTYFVSVRDNSGCQLDNYLVTVPSGPALAPTWTINPPSCNGASNGGISINSVANGTGPFQYQIDGTGFNTSNIFGNLATGSHLVAVKDVAGCSVNVLLTVPQGTGVLQMTATPTGTSCPGANNGSIQLQATSGSGPYQYSVNGAPFQPGSVATGLAAGTYSVVLKDGAGCTSAPSSVTVSAGSALLANATPGNAACTGVNNGKVIVTPTNGAGPYRYAIDGGAQQTDSIFQNISAGTHTVVVTDGAGCVSAPITVTVGVSAAVTGSPAVTGTSCSGASDGQLQITPSNGTAPYQYALDGGSYQPTSIFTNLSSTTHSITVKDALGCTSQPISFTINPGAPLTGSAAATATSCTGVSNGTVTVTINATPQQVSNWQPVYAIDGGVPQSGTLFSGVSSGSHQVVISSPNGCSSAPISIAVPVGPPLTATYTATSTSCSGATNGTVTLQPQSTGGPFQYSIDNGGYQSSPLFSALPSGTHVVLVKDQFGCLSNPINAIVPPGQPLTGTAQVTPVLCNGGSSGSMTLTIPGNPTPPISYQLGSGPAQSTPVFNGLAAGSYTVNFADNNGCAGSTQFTIVQPTQVAATVAKRAVSCNGQSDGLLRVTASGGTGPYTYSIDGTAYQQADSFHVPADTYTVYVKDNNGCIQQVPAQTITQPAVLTATTAATSAVCSAQGTITVTATGGTTGYVYSINGTTFQSSNVFNVNPGDYTVVVKDANGCTTTATQHVNLSDNLVVTPQPDATICEGLSTTLQPTTNATQFSWTPAYGLNDTVAHTPTAAPAVTTSYILKATLGLCTAYDTVVVNVNPAPVADAGPDGNICYGQTYTLQGNGGVTYSWSPNTDFVGSATDVDPVVAPTHTTQYSLMVTDAKGCRSLTPGSVTVNVTPPIQVQISRDTAVALGDVFQLHASSAATDYLWNPGYGLDDPTKANPMVTVTGDITYTVTASTSAGCKGSASVTLKVYQGPEIYLPTAFTPNGDGKNDILKPFPIGIKQITYFRVFNRWGQQVFATSEFNKGWDGKISGKDQPAGTYVWVVEGITKDNRKITQHGTTVLIR